MDSIYYITVSCVKSFPVQITGLCGRPHWFTGGWVVPWPHQYWAFAWPWAAAEVCTLHHMHRFVWRSGFTKFSIFGFRECTVCLPYNCNYFNGHWYIKYQNFIFRERASPVSVQRPGIRVGEKWHSCLPTACWRRLPLTTGTYIFFQWQNY